MKKKTNVKYLNRTLALLVVVLLTFGFVASSVSAWDWPDPDDLDDWWDDTKDKAEDWWDDTKDETQDWYDQTKDKAEGWWDDTKDTASDLGDKSYSRLADEWRDFPNALRDNWDLAIEKARTGPYISEVWDMVSIERERQLCEDYNDPEKVGELERRRELITETAIVTIKIIPIYDPEQKQVRTFDGFARDLVKENPALNGSDLAKDPTRCAALLLLDSDYLLYAKIIQTSDGKWISIEEAQIAGYKINEVNMAKSEYVQARNAYTRGDSRLVEKHLESFSSKIQAINKRSPYSSWLLPTGIVAVAGVVSIGFLINRNRCRNKEKAQ